jgi:hypothetical protein
VLCNVPLNGSIKVRVRPRAWHLWSTTVLLERLTVGVRKLSSGDQTWEGFSPS